MNRKIAACFLAGILSITAVPVPAAAQEAVSGKNVSEEPMDAIRAQEIAMEKQEELEKEENMPAEEPDPLVLDEDGKVVPASAASWTEETYFFFIRSFAICGRAIVSPGLSGLISSIEILKPCS